VEGVRQLAAVTGSPVETTPPLVEPASEDARPAERAPATPQPPAPAGPVAEPTEGTEEVQARVLNLFTESLSSRTIQETLQEAFVAVVERWDEIVPEAPQRNTFPQGSDIYSAANTMGFHVYRLQGNYEIIRTLDLPAVLEIKLGDILGRRYVALVDLHGEVAEVKPLLTDGTSLVPERMLEELWYGNAYILWKDWVGGSPIVIEGMHGEEVTWLQSALIELGYLAGKPTGIFDGNTRLAVQNFQRATGLERDGILGPQTKIVLFRALNRFRMPLLETGGRS
jgi:general secretion pathway protein A